MNTRRRGIYLLPNLFTTSALFFGFYAIIAAISARYEAAAIAMFVAMVLDGMDGRIARMTNTQSDFGEQYDSLADLISFGLAPSLVMYQWSLYGLGKLGWLAAFVYAAATALRLARFNTQAATDDKQFFQGLPSPAAAALIAGFIWLGDANGHYDGTNLLWLTFPLTIIAGLLMVSNVRYHSFKQIDLKGRVPFMYILALVLVLVLIALRPSVVLFVLAFIYASSGPVMTLLLIRRHRAKRRMQDGS
jgi:CDP-diacylglycerol---serine O-phosphatidyltransferase